MWLMRLQQRHGAITHHHSHRCKLWFRGDYSAVYNVTDVTPTLAVDIDPLTLTISVHGNNHDNGHRHMTLLGFCEAQQAYIYKEDDDAEC